ncbi:MAG: NAD(P)-dependent oxidoreductase [Candidatus Omnitrophica bacterium]|nr:NAD(P)-dependent oxidoreductase [Candidatus Omnitrophota bacterium]MDD5672071.1 NAD(P)-dependent oxidoreductase [Candidatus Omnitrophota bacterium]
MNQKRKILLTGGTGLLGGEFIRRYASELDIYALCRPGTPLAFPPSVKVIPCDLSSDFDTKGWPQGLDAVMHMAQSRRYKDFPDGTSDVFRVNVISTMKLLEYARKNAIRKFVFASSGSIFGGSKDPIREDTTPHPGTFYALSKWQSEGLIRQYQPVLDAAILRFFFIYGPGQEMRFIPTLTQRIRQGKTVTLAGERGFKFSLMFVSDAADSVFKVLGTDGVGILNLAGEEVNDLYTVANKIGSLLKLPVSFEVRPDTQEHYVVDVRKMIRLLGFVPPTSTDEGLRKTLEAQSTPLPH